MKKSLKLSYDQMVTNRKLTVNFIKNVARTVLGIWATEYGCANTTVIKCRLQTGNYIRITVNQRYKRSDEVQGIIVEEKIVDMHRRWLSQHPQDVCEHWVMFADGVVNVYDITSDDCTYYEVASDVATISQSKNKVREVKYVYRFANPKCTHSFDPRFIYVGYDDIVVPQQFLPKTQQVEKEEVKALF